MPTIAQNLQRLQQARTAMANSIIAKGGTVPAGDGLEEFAADISTIAPFEMTGELPLTFKSDGESLRDYAVHGKTSKNLFDIEGWLTANGVEYTKNGNSYTFSIAQSPLYNQRFKFSNEDVEVTLSSTITSQDATSVGFDILNTNDERVLSRATAGTAVGCELRLNWSTSGTITVTAPMLNAGSAPLPYEPYYDGIGERTANLLDCTSVSTTINNVTFTHNNDGSITVNGTATATTVYQLKAVPSDTYWPLPDLGLKYNTSYILSGCPDGGALDGGYRLIFRSGGPAWNYSDLGNGVSFNISDTGSTLNWMPCIVVTEGVTANNLLFKPMIRLASIADPTFEPYGYKIPITCGNTTTNLYTPSKLYEGDTLTYAQTGVDIPTVDGVNTLDTTLDTKFSMDIQYGDFPIYDNINAAINVLKGTATTYKPADMADEILDAIPDVEVSGDIVSVTDAAAYPAERLEFAIEPVQEGSGDPSPTNVRPISGWTGVNGERTGVNVWDEEWRNGYYDSNGVFYATPSSPSNLANIKAICVKPDTDYYFVAPNNNGNTVCWYDGSMALISADTNARFNAVITSPSGARYLNFKANYSDATEPVYNHDISINYPSTDTEYHAYTGTSIPITFPTEAGTVYGGKVDVVNGKLTVNKGIYTITQDTNISKSGNYFEISDVLNSNAERSYSFISNFCIQTTVSLSSMPLNTGRFVTDRKYFAVNLDYETSEQAKSALISINAQIVYELATPIEYDITPQQVQMLLGDNNIWCDTGDTALKYKVDLGRYIAKLQAAQATPQLSLSRQAVSLDAEPRDETTQNEDEGDER